MDSEGPEFTNIKGSIHKDDYEDQSLDGGHHIQHKDMINAHNSQFIDPRFRNGQFKRFGDKYAYSDMKRRGYSEHLGDESQYDPENNLRQFYHDDTGVTEFDYTLLDPNEPLILDHGIMKFHPGFSINYVSRWIQVTRTVIRFYK